MQECHPRAARTPSTSVRCLYQERLIDTKKMHFQGHGEARDLGVVVAITGRL